MLQKYASNRESMVILKKRIESLNTTIESVVPKGGPCPSKLKEQLDIFSKYVRVSSVKSKVKSRVVSLTRCGYRNVETVAIEVGRLQGNEGDRTTKKLARGASQTLRADKIADELDSYVRNLSGYLDSLMVRVDSSANNSGTSC